MLSISLIGPRISSARKTQKLSQTELARRAGVSRATLAALENGRAGELGFSKITKILSVLGLELKIHDSNSQRPTLDELLAEDSE